jgi:prepilin-type processing-associated H-X9-DG protein
LAHPVNTNNRSAAADKAPNWGSGGVGRCGLNNPLSSAHGNGAMVGFLDGHVVFLMSNTGLEVLQRLAVRDDGGVVPRL